jgi:AbrB family looped-hinge helix DNA binding protein
MAASSPVVEYLATTNIGEKGQITVPKQFRDELQLKPGSPIAVLRMGNGLLLIPEQERFERLCEKISGALLGAGATPESLLATLPEVREELFKEWYGDLGPAVRPKRTPRKIQAK